jgi:exopolysaccharide biosynthesis predicted pyruvyltransferase EpsI
MVSEYLVEMMGQLFADREMLFLPQTIHFTDEKIKRRLSEKISSNVTIMCRDIVSYQNASEIFPKSKIVLYPDMVTSLIGRYHFKHQRKGILFCLRKNGDGESLISDDEEKKLIDDIKKIAEASVTDTTISVDWRKIAENRKYYVEKEIEYYSKFQLVITNRYHGTIFSLAADTPVIVLPTKDHKITAGLRWFEEAEYDGIYYCNKSEEVRAVAQDIIDRCETICHPDYFYQKYYKDFMIEEV